MFVLHPTPYSLLPGHLVMRVGAMRPDGLWAARSSLASAGDWRLKRSTCCSSATAVVRSDSIPAAVVAISVRLSWLSEWMESRLALDWSAAAACCEAAMAIWAIMRSTRSAMPMMRSSASPAWLVVTTPCCTVSGAALHAGDGGAGAVLNALDHAGDLAGGLGGAFGEAADLSGDDGEAAALVSCARGFDGGVEGEQVGLARDLVDDGDDLGDALRESSPSRPTVAEVSLTAVAMECMVPSTCLTMAPPSRAVCGGVAGGLGGGLGVARDLGDGGGHLLHGGCGLLGLLALLVDAAMDLVAGGAHGGGAAGERAGGVGDRADDAAQAALHLLHGDGEGADLVVAVQVERLAGQVARGDRVGAFGDHGDGAGDAPGEQERDEAADDGAEDGREPKRVERGAVGAAQVDELSVGLRSSATGPDR